MPITVIVRSAGDEDARLTFDGTQRVVIGRGAGSDVRLPDPSVSHRHATVCAQGADFVILDEGSTNGTSVGDVPVAPRTSRILRDGDVVRVGRLRLEIRIEHTAVTRDVAAATKELALALVSRALAAAGSDVTVKIRVVEGRDQGRTLPLGEEGREYIVGRGPHCDLALADADVSREHLCAVRRGGAVFIRDLATKNGTWVGEIRNAPGTDAPWRSSQVVRIGRTVLALQEPLAEALAAIEGRPDEEISVVDAPQEAAPSPVPTEAATQGDSSLGEPASESDSAGVAVEVASSARGAAKGKPGAAWSLVDRIAVAAALGVMALSLAGLVWLFRG
ncbi:MAG TPA: FHA domain-containing protein [Polyangiaceae bacterium]|nr:FHA domain-containing protein [Polyangiaceae bacterium]